MTPIAYYEKRYAIKECGQIINLANNLPLRPIKNPNGYLKVGLANGDGTFKQVSVHTLVARHFIPNPYSHPQVNHKDGDKENCHKDNLEWVSAQQNIHHAFKTGLRPGYMSASEKEEHLKAVLNGEMVGDIAKRINRRPETLHKMLRERAKALGLYEQWKEKMQENRRNVALRNLEKINNNRS